MVYNDELHETVDNCTRFMDDPAAFVKERDALAKHERLDAKLPKFDQWTLIDVMQRRIYATFETEAQLSAFLKREDLTQILNRILHDRVIAATSSSISNLYERHELVSPEYIRLMKGCVQVEFKSVDPVRWSVGNNADSEVNALYGELYDAGLHDKYLDERVELDRIF